MPRVIIQDWRGDVVTSVDEPETQPLELPDELRYNHRLIDELQYAYQQAASMLGPDSKIDIVLRLTYRAYPNCKQTQHGRRFRGWYLQRRAIIEEWGDEDDD